MKEKIEDLIGEEWRDVPDYEEHYQVSNLGRIKSIKFGKESIIKGQKIGTKKQYLKIKLVRNGKETPLYIHELVMLAFVGECPDEMIICHSNDVGIDNKLTNLRYDTRTENKIDMYRIDPNYKHGRKGLNSYEVCYCRMLWKTGNVSIEDMATMFKANKQNIYKCITYQTFSWLSIDNQIEESKTAIRYNGVFVS